MRGLTHSHKRTQEIDFRLICSFYNVQNAEYLYQMEYNFAFLWLLLIWLSVLNALDI